jgi:hypothetical protein
VVGLELLFGLLSVAVVVCLLYWTCPAALSGRLLLPGRWWQERRAARERAEVVLRELLTEDEYRQLNRLGYLGVPSPSRPGRTYRVPHHGGQVRVYEGGRPIMALCVQSVVPMPAGDVVLMHKLMIEGNEVEYLRIANRLSVVDDGSGLRPVAG